MFLQDADAHTTGVEISFLQYKHFLWDFPKNFCKIIDVKYVFYDLKIPIPPIKHRFGVWRIRKEQELTKQLKLVKTKEDTESEHLYICFKTFKRHILLHEYFSFTIFLAFYYSSFFLLLVNLRFVATHNKFGQ